METPHNSGTNIISPNKKGFFVFPSAEYPDQPKRIGTGNNTETLVDEAATENSSVVESVRRPQE